MSDLPGGTADDAPGSRDLRWVLERATEDGDRVAECVADAEGRGDDDLADVLRRVRQDYLAIAEHAEELLRQRSRHRAR